jgi:hypothetical protein
MMTDPAITHLRLHIKHTRDLNPRIVAQRAGYTYGYTLEVLRGANQPSVMCARALLNAAGLDLVAEPEPQDAAVECARGVDPLVRSLCIARRVSGLRLCDLAERSGVSMSAMSHWWNAGRVPTLWQLRAVLGVVGVGVVVRRATS